MIKFLSNLKSPILFFFLSASAAFAADAPIAPNNVKTFGGTAPDTPANVMEFTCIVVKLALDFIPYMVLIAVGAFLFGLIKYVGHGDNEETRTEGIKLMIYGCLGFFFMVSVWGILQISAAGFGLQLVIPQFKANQPYNCV